MQMLGVYLLIVGPWWLYAWFTFGTVIPNTAVAKSTSVPSWSAIWHSVVDIMRLLVASYGAVLLVFLVGWGGTYIRRGRVKSNMPLASVLWVGLYQGVQIVKGVDVVARYFLLVSPLLIVAAFEGLGQLMTTIAKEKRLMLPSLCLVLAVLNSVVLTTLLIYPAAVAFDRGFQATYIEIGQWLATHTPPEATVAVADIGAVGYFAHRKIFDLGGLVTPEAIPYLWGKEIFSNWSGQTIS